MKSVYTILQGRAQVFSVSQVQDPGHEKPQIFSSAVPAKIVLI
jgi:hypothetical protein